MKGNNESEEEFLSRYRRGEAHADSKKGRPPQSTGMWVGVAFASGSFPAYIALLAAGYDGDRLQIPLICAGIGLAALAYLIIWEKKKLWHAELNRYMERTKPED